MNKNDYIKRNCENHYPFWYKTKWILAIECEIIFNCGIVGHFYLKIVPIFPSYNRVFCVKYSISCLGSEVVISENRNLWILRSIIFAELISKCQIGSLSQTILTRSQVSLQIHLYCKFSQNETLVRKLISNNNYWMFHLPFLFYLETGENVNN